MTVKHTILLSSSYSLGKRICLHYADAPESEISRDHVIVRDAYGGKRVLYSVHVIHTESKGWDSVVSTDPYFADVEPIPSVEKFVELIQKDRYLSGLDVARYILSKTSCTHTRLQKLTYMCYADYICKTGEKLFDDRIYAFDYGPVIEKVYRRYAESSHLMPGTALDDQTAIEGPPPMSIRSRVLFQEDGDLKLDSIEETLKRYQHTSTQELVDLTHREGSPWSLTRRSQQDQISDKDIKLHHLVEIS